MLITCVFTSLLSQSKPDPTIMRRLKKSVTHNQYREHFSDFHDAVRSFFDLIPKQQPDLKKLLSPNFRIIGVSC